MLGGLPVVGGIYKALTGETDYRARAPKVDIKAGTEAIRQQTALAGRRAAQGSYSLAASARGPGAALAAREAARRGAMAQQAGVEQAGIAQQNLIQGTNALNAQNEMQAQGINAQIASQNSQGLSRLAGAALSGGALMMLSDMRAKQDAFQAGALAQAAQQPAAGGPFGNLYGSQMAGHEDGRRVTLAPDPARDKRQAEMDSVQRDANAAGVTLGPSDWQAMGYQTSDKRAKVLAEENSALRDALHSAVLRASGVPTMPVPRRMQTGLARAAQPGAAQAAASTASPDVYEAMPSPPGVARMHGEVSRPLSAAEQVQLDQQAAGMPAPAPRPVQVVSMAPQPAQPSLAAMLQNRLRLSDEDAKMEFPAGVKPRTFAYKPGMGPPGEEPGEINVGLYAQDLEKSPEGATVVEEDPETGLKMVDTGKLTMLVTGKMAEMEKRMKALEGRRRG